jgi:hypothetical protein|eukprot:COSAG02_NODE_786_length_17199_cov_25.278889_19_plen_82_part_00
MKTLLASFCTAGQIGGLVSLGLLMNDFPNGDLQGQSFSSASNTAWQMLWGQGLLIGAERYAHDRDAVGALVAVLKEPLQLI